MVPHWAVVDKLVHELGSLRSVVDEVDARPELADADVALELRTSLARAADTIHLVIGGNEGMVAQAWRTIAEAQEVSARARTAIADSRTAHADLRSTTQKVKAQVQRTKLTIAGLQSTRGQADIRRVPKKEPGPAN